ncbi:D-alanyl-D-alanine carboxypeptidase family protein [Hoeflea prorocentri]|uniref:D-alanyl-D-alanine carboxypeptidase n=1 Tax=Hoeflea prorocentri TaxID=1922333 RepID=A0A9X3UQU2_9HYPH|nr:D-alanyl-D-alanine carboxypeptidase family protein [Hoeflea prorocentri]MCY6383526.1 D-alanyl-D-alanine carboxypeptidase [Hoeflea prorocentri]MDA5401326.1 D-alanyl-D-alanine carboxypeptidase [Hoeflea prorocentri]
MHRVSSVPVICLIALVIAAVLTAGAKAAGPTIVVDVKSGKVLEHKDAFQRWYPASLTKLMTAYVVFRQVQAGAVSMDGKVTISNAAAKAPPSKMYFKPGSQLTLDNAIKIIMVKSANDVSVAIGETIAGSRDAFVAMMNAEARRIGMTDTRFVNASGLPGKGQRTTARDMAVLGVALLREFPQYSHYFALEAISTGKKTYTNYNILIGRFAGANGMKTGFICSSGFNQVSSATRKGRTVVSVVLGAKDQEERAVESARLLQKGLTTPGLAKPTLKGLRPYGQNRLQIVDLRPVVCSQEARKARYGGRDVEGRMTLSSAYISPLGRKARAVPVGLTGRVPAALTAGRIPVPKARPVRIGGSDSPVTASQAKPASNVPVPQTRPSL